MSIAEEKAALRKTMRQRLKELQVLANIHESQSILAAERLMGHPLLQKAGTVLCFASCGSEISTDPLVDALLLSDRKVALPRTEGNTMTFHLLPSDARAGNWKPFLECGDFGILVPSQTAPLFDPATSPGAALCVLPGLAFDASGNRLGKGKGFYDRYLAAFPDLPTAGFAFDFQVVDSVPVEDGDRPCNAVITDLNVMDILS